ncbi:AMP-binding protein [Streptomyces sp. NPDC020965]|uniref:AMP-binding protein n=1 Tax=Streptomyces sp. NPDC020965 TaxID=3365105 RepID=UPI0037AE1C5D
MSGGTLHELFEDRVRTGPDRTAVITDRIRLSYRLLDARANRVARHLIETVRLPAGGLVAIRTLRQPDALVAVLGVLKAGGSYAVVGPDRPEPVALAEAKAVISHRRHLGRVEGGDRPVILLDGDAAGIEAHSTDPLRPARPSGARAAVLLTAGTTGPPRPVATSHHRLVAAYASWSEVFRLVPDDRVLVTAPADTTDFTAGWIRTLCSGATLVLTRREPYTVADTDPATATALIDGAGPPPALRLLAVGGERLRLDEQVRLERSLPPGTRVIQVYGPTEVAGCGTWFETGQLPGPVDDPARHAYLGVPFPGCDAQIRKGRIWLTPPEGGDAVLTGDLGRRDGTGPLEFRGRAAHRVRVQGRTVDTYRIEAALTAHPRIRESVVGQDGGALIAYVLPDSGSPPGKEGVRRHLTGDVPTADIPAVVVPISTLPRNDAGKVDRGKLIRPPVRPTSLPPGKGGGGFSDPADMAGVAAMAFLLATVLSLVLTDSIWPGSTDLSIVPNPWATLFRGLYVVESVAFGVGVAFLVGGRPLMSSRGKPRGLTSAAHLAIGWLLVSWWPQDNFYRLAAKQDWERQAALVYSFNVPLMIAAMVVVLWAVWGGWSTGAEDRK